jgi:restriction system protein
MVKQAMLKKIGEMGVKVQGLIGEKDINLEKLKSNINLNLVREQIIKLAQKTIQNIGREEDRKEVVDWFISAREVLEKETSMKDKAKELYSSIDSVQVVKIFFTSFAETLKSYMKSSLPLPLKVALPITAVATLFLGSQGAGIAALGGAIGLPVIALFFIGSAGITAIIEPFLKSDMREEAKLFLAGAFSVLGVLVLQNKLSKSMEEQIKREASTPKKQKLSEDEEKLKEELQNMDPFDFERHIMTFFEDAGLKSVVTKASNDFGLDGWAVHEKGLIIVQCKRNSDKNKIGRPTVQQFKGVIEEQRKKGSEIYKGFIVTTSTFTNEAKSSAELNEDLILVDVGSLLKWHSEGIEL